MRGKALFLAVSVSLNILALSINLRGATINVPANQPTIQAGIGAATNGDTVMVASGTYTGTGNVNVNFNGKAITVRSYAGSQSTIIDCGAPGNRAFVFDHGESATSILTGFTIRNGDVRHKYEGGLPDKNGGAINIKASPVIQGYRFEVNKAQVGGAVHIMKPIGGATNVSPSILDCVFINDSVISAGAGSGGGICAAAGANPTILRCVFLDNYCDAFGGAIFTSENATIDLCLFIHNTSPQGGAINVAGTTLVEECTFAKNVAIGSGHGGAAIFGDFSQITFRQNIVAYNDAPYNCGAGIWCSPGSSASFFCNDFWSNQGGDLNGNACDSSDFDANTIFLNPLFCDTANDNYSISAYSPCDEDYSPCGQLIGSRKASCGIGIVGDGGQYSKWKNIRKADNVPTSIISKIGVEYGRREDADKLDAGVDDTGNDSLQYETSDTKSLNRISQSAMLRNYPNPFNPTTTIEMQLPTPSGWTLRIFSILGQKIGEFSGNDKAGTMSVTWDASQFSSGIYFYKLQVGNFEETKKMLLLK